MEAGVYSIRTGKKDKKVLRKRAVNEDRISGLPNEILVQILSLLPTADAVCTGVLSKRWERLWAAVPVLHFDFDNYTDTDNDTYTDTDTDTDTESKDHVNFYGIPNKDTEFVKFVDRVLMLHDLPFLSKFSLTYSGTNDPSHINAWISTALKRNVQELHLCLEGIDGFPLPRRLFVSDTISILKIDSVVSLIKLPSSVCLPNLKVLHLKSLTIHSHQSNRRVSFIFPILQEFELDNCYWRETESVEIVTPALETLTFDDYAGDDSDCEIKVYAETLEPLDEMSELTSHITICNLSSLVMACIHIFVDDETPFDCTTNFFRGISRVRHLKLSDCCVEVLSQPDILPHLKDFTSLVRLEVEVRRGYFVGVNFKKLIDLLCHLPTVEYFQFHNYESKSLLRDAGSCSSVKVVPQRCMPHLKFVKMSNFHGYQNELFFVEFLLNNARALEEISIVSLPPIPEDSKKHIEAARESLFHRTSECVIHLS